MIENTINLAIEVDSDLTLQLGIEEPIELLVVKDNELHIVPKDRKLVFLTGGEAGNTDTDYLLLYQIAKL